MLKTNSRVVRERIRIYVIGNGEDIRESMEFDEIPSNKIDDILKYVWTVFMDNYGRFTHKGVSLQEEFSTFASGLPFNIFDYHYNVSAVDLVGDLLDETEAERSKYSESEAEKLMDYLIFRECEKAGRQ